MAVGEDMHQTYLGMLYKILLVIEAADLAPRCAVLMICGMGQLLICQLLQLTCWW
ncbi:MAG: hypothetical protein ABWK05_02695 [Pyrobaculum sp.]